jgi:hypothetical protein
MCEYSKEKRAESLKQMVQAADNIQQRMESRENDHK